MSLSSLKLHNAMWPGLVGKGDDDGQEPPISLEKMLDFSAALIGLGVNDLSHDPEILQSAMTTLLKTKSDQWNITTEVAQRIAGQAA